jgi:hypothetical protein
MVINGYVRKSRTTGKLAHVSALSFDLGAALLRGSVFDFDLSFDFGLRTWIGE